MTELDYILQNFEDRFRCFKGRRITLYPGEYLDEIVRHFDREYHFHYISESEITEIQNDIDLVILTDRRREKEPDYNSIREFCERQGISLRDLFGMDLVQLHQELDTQKHLTISQWKELLAPYDVVTITIHKVAVKIFKLEDRWILRRRFLILYNWLKSQNKTVLFFWDDEEQLRPLMAAGIDLSGCLFKRKDNDPGFLKLIKQYPGRKIIHIGVDTVKDGIIPREYGLDSHLSRGFSFQDRITSTGERACYYIDKKSLYEAIDQHDVISFDIFDTLLKRLVLYPKDVFEMAEQRTGADGFADSRYHVQTTCTHFSLDEIYGWLKEKCGYDDKTAEILRRTELQIESDIICPRRSMVEIFNYAKSRNKTIILVSDMYLDPDFIRNLLEKNGITGYRALFLSHQFKKHKHEGLFEELSEFRKTGETILHIGDNHYSDYSAAKKYGLDAFYVPSCLDIAKKNGFAEVIAKCGTLSERKLLGLGLALAFDDPFTLNDDLQIADMIIAPLVISYLQWVRGELKEKGYDYFLLSSRDGKMLLDAYDRLYRQSPGRLPPGRYFYTSRHAAYLTIIDNYQQAEYFFDLKKYRDNPQKLLKQIFGIPEGKILPYQGESVEDYYQMHEPVIREAAEKNRDNYLKYLTREGLIGRKTAIMDFVSEGSTQMMLEKHFPITMDGYYVGIPEYVFKYAGNIRYFFDHDLMNYDMEMKLEVYFTSPEPAIDRIGENGAPVFAEEVRDGKTLDRIRRIQETVQSFLDLYLDKLYDQEDAFDKELIFQLCGVIRQYDVENYYFDDMSGREILPGS